MAHLWIEEGTDNWAVIPLESSCVALERIGGSRSADDTSADGEAVLLRDDTHDRPAWHLLAAAYRPVRVNGIPLMAGLRVLSDRDEIALSDGATFFFSTRSWRACRRCPRRPEE
jgi:hypothetical protein